MTPPRTHRLLVIALLMTFVCCPNSGIASTSAALSALVEVRASSDSPPGVQSVWDNYLELGELESQLESGAPTAEQIQQAVSRLRRVERQLDPDRTQRLLAALRSWLDENPPSAPIDEPQLDAIPADEAPGDVEEEAAAPAAESTKRVVAAAAKLRDWLEFYRLRTWQEVLALDDLIENVGMEAPGAASADDLYQFLLAESQPRTHEARIRLRRALEDQLDRQQVPLENPLAQTTRQRKQKYRHVSDDQLTHLQQRTREAARQLTVWLDTGTPANRDGWKEYLKLNRLEDALAYGNRPALRDLARSYQQFKTGARGLDNKKFRDVRNALRDYLEVLQFAESNADRISPQQQRVEKAVNYLDRALAGAGATKEQNWKKYLHWDDLNRVIADSSPDPREVSRLLKRFEADENGLQLSPFRDVQRELLKHLELMQLGRSVSNVDRYRRQMERIARAIKRYRSEPSSAAAAELGDLLAWLQMTGYAPDVVASVKNSTSRPNLRVVIDGPLLVDAIADTRNEAIPVNRCFERARVTGVANTTANFNGQLVPATGGIAIDILVRGSTITNATARQRRVSVYTQGLTDMTGSKRVFMNENGISSWPAVATASTRQNICGVNVNRRCGRRLIGRFACRRASRTTPKAECMTNQEAKQTLARRLDTETASMLSDANRQLQERLSQLRENEVYPDEISLSSTHEHVRLVAKTAPDGYLAAPYDPPPRSINGGQVLAEIHESLINNALGKRLGGMYLDNELLVERMRENGLEVPDELLPRSERKNQQASPNGDKEDEEPDEWTMTFDDRYPILVRFADGQARIAIRGRKFSNEEQEIDELIEISAMYQVDRLPDGKIQATRLGKIDVNFVNTPGRLSGAQLSYKTFLLRKMDPLFREMFTTDDMPTSGEMGELISSIEPLDVLLDRGWLTTSLQVDSEALQSLMPLGQ